jgi:hypothetical protein
MVNDDSVSSVKFVKCILVHLYAKIFTRFPLYRLRLGALLYYEMVYVFIVRVATFYFGDISLRLFFIDDRYRLTRIDWVFAT